MPRSRHLELIEYKGRGLKGGDAHSVHGQTDCSADQGCAERCRDNRASETATTFGRRGKVCVKGKEKIG